MNEKKVDFTYPEGFMEAANSLTFLPENARAEFLMIMVSSILMM
ncbi:MAG: hypothetical protein ACC608_06315 [Anaerofustis sp.]